MGLKLDLGCGKALQDGYTGVDFLPLKELWPDGALLENGSTVAGSLPLAYRDRYEQVNLFEFPWPWGDNSVEEVYTSHLVEHIPHYRPEYEGQDGWWKFFGELYRVMDDNGIVRIRHPFSRSDRAFQDPTHTRFVHINTWWYLQKNFRLKHGVDHYTPDVDFLIETIDVFGTPTLLEGKSEQNLQYANEFYFNPCQDLEVQMRVMKSETTVGRPLDAAPPV